MNEQNIRYTLDELSSLVELPQRTVRYYIQMGLMEPPLGKGRGAHYGPRHLEQLLEVRKWQQAGLSLERIRELLGSGDDEKPVPPTPPRRAGSIEVWSHIVVDDGLELTVDPKRAGLSSEQLREFVQQVMALYESSKASTKE